MLSSPAASAMGLGEVDVIGIDVCGVECRLRIGGGMNQRAQSAAASQFDISERRTQWAHVVAAGGQRRV